MKVTWVDDSLEDSAADDEPVIVVNTPCVLPAGPAIEAITDDGESPFEAEIPEANPSLEYVDRTMAGKVLTRSIRNTTTKVWKNCYPGAFWMEWGERMQAPTTKGPCLGDIQPGERRKFEVVIPRFPSREEPDLLRIAILEDEVDWHNVEDMEVR